METTKSKTNYSKEQGNTRKILLGKREHVPPPQPSWTPPLKTAGGPWTMDIHRCPFPLSLSQSFSTTSITDKSLFLVFIITKWWKVHCWPFRMILRSRSSLVAKLPGDASETKRLISRDLIDRTAKCEG